MNIYVNRINTIRKTDKSGIPLLIDVDISENQLAEFIIDVWNDYGDRWMEKLFELDEGTIK